jgi:LPS-assembly lipoprotein
MKRTLCKLTLRTPVLASVLASLLVTAGCGFHLRGYGVVTAFDDFFLVASSNSIFQADLRQTLRTAGASESASRTDADVVIEILDERNQQRAASTTGNARVAEYELEVGALVGIQDGGGNVLAAPQWVNRVRVYRIDRDNLTGNSQEQTLVERELRADVVQAVLRTVNAVTRNRVVNAGNAG